MALFGVYLGSIYIPTTSGETSVQFKPGAGSGGSNNVVGIWNAYNRVRINSVEADSNTGWTYASSTWEPLDGASSNTNNRVTFVDGLGQTSVRAKLATLAYNTTAGNNSFIGVNENHTNSASATSTYIQPTTGGGAVGAAVFTVEDAFPPSLGLNYVQALQSSPNSVTVTYAFNGGETTLIYDGEY